MDNAVAEDFNPTVHLNLMEALAQPGCAMCRLSLVSLKRYFDHLTFEFVNDFTIRDAIRSSWGFCAAHGEMLLEKQDALGTAIIYRDVLKEIANQLKVPANDAGSGFLARFLKKKPEAAAGRDSDCPACVTARQTADSYLTLLLKSFETEETKERFSGSSGLCVLHFERALELPGGDSADFRLAQLAIWERLVGELSEFIRRSDHRFQHEPMGEERDSWRRAVQLVSGIEGQR